MCLRSAQFGGWVGALVGVAVAAVRRKPMLMTLTNGCRNGMMIGFPIGAPMTYMRMSALNKVVCTD